MEEDGSSLAVEVEPPQPKNVFYCGACGFPPELCAYGQTDFETKCRPWLVLNFPGVFEMYPQWDEEGDACPLLV